MDEREIFFEFLMMKLAVNELSMTTVMSPKASLCSFNIYHQILSDLFPSYVTAAFFLTLLAYDVVDNERK